MSGKAWTVAILGCFFFGLIFYDIWALTVWGVDTTISVIINEWAFSHPAMNFFVGAIFGGLFVHFFGWKPK